jgi:DNA (cytosine-5)-methyltransferase 1
VDSPPVNVLSLCTGGAGLDLGARLAGLAARTVCYVEIESYACEVLARRMEEARLDPAPVWTDLRTFDGRPWRGSVDLVVAGFPCTDISNAGLRAGIEGEHSGLWFEVARIVREVGPGYVFLENVPPLVVRGLDRVLGELAEGGWDAEWDLFSAAEVGAPHVRERFFLLARHVSNADGRELRFEPERDQRQGRRERTPERRHSEPRSVVEELAHSDGERLREPGSARPESGETGQRDAEQCGSEVADAMHAGRPAQRRVRGPAAERLELVDWPPGPDDGEGWRAYLERYPGLEPAIRRGSHGLAHRVDELRMLGNGVVPQTAALALWTLYARLEES